MTMTRLYALGALATSPNDPPGAFLGRQQEMAALWALVGESEGGQAPAILLEGALGMGKTRLLRRLLRGGAGAMPVLTLSCRQAQRAVPFWPLAATWRQAGLSTRDGPLPAEPERAVEAWATRVAGLLTVCANLIVVDAAQWADGWTLRVLDALRSGAFGRPPALLLALRPGDHDALLDTLLEDTRAQRAPLGPLSTATLAGELARHAADEGTAQEVAAWLTESTAGLPYLVAAALHSLRQDGVIYGERERWRLRRPPADEYPAGQLPQPAQRRLVGALAALGKEDLEALRICAAAGGAITPSVLQSYTSWPVAPVLDRLAAGRLLARSEDEWIAPQYRLALPGLAGAALEGLGVAESEALARQVGAS